MQLAKLGSQVDIGPDKIIGDVFIEWQIDHVAVIFTAQCQEHIFNNFKGCDALGFLRVLV